MKMVKMNFKKLQSNKIKIAKNVKNCYTFKRETKKRGGSSFLGGTYLPDERKEGRQWLHILRSFSLVSSLLLLLVFVMRFSRVKENSRHISHM